VKQSSEQLVLDLPDSRRLIVPLDWYPRLQHGSDAERRNCQLLGDGYAIEWPDLDEHIGIEGRPVDEVARARPRSTVGSQ
jgi:hypothetical protein